MHPGELSEVKTAVDNPPGELSADTDGERCQHKVGLTIISQESY